MFLALVADVRHGFGSTGLYLNLVFSCLKLLAG